MSDVRFAVRGLLRRPALAVGAVVTLALGIGANATIFGIVNAVLLRSPSGLESPDRLVAVYTSDFSGPAYGASSFADYEALRENRMFAGLASHAGGRVSVGEGAAAVPASGIAVSANYFDVLGARPAAGRFLRPEEESSGAGVVVLGHAVAVRLYGSAESAVGQVTIVNGNPLEVIGVTRPGFVGFDRSAPGDLFVPTVLGWQLGMGLPDRDERSSRGIAMVGRLAEGMTVEQARSAMQVAAGQLHAAYETEWTDVRGEPRRLTVLRESEARVPPDSRGEVFGLASVLMGTVAILLLICCANVAGLLMARTVSRSRELGIRISLGAGTGRLTRQLLTESMVLAVAGGGAGLLLSFWATDLVTRSIGSSASIGIAFQATVDPRVAGFTALVTIVTGALFGLAPALGVKRTDVMAVLKSEQAGSASGRATGRSLLVAGQLMLAVPLLVGSILLARTLRNAYRIDAGFAMERVLLVNASPPPGEGSAAESVRVLEELRQRLVALPGVASASYGWSAPLSGFGPRRGMQVRGYEASPGEDMEFHVNHVGPDFFGTAGIPLERGRGIDETDRAGGAPVVVVNKAFAERFWSDRDPIGEQIGMSGTEWTVVGMAADVRYLSLTEPARPYVWIPSQQMARGTLLHIRTTGDPRGIVPSVTRTVAEIAPTWVISGTQTMEDRIAGALFTERVAGAMITLFALMALVLTSVGLYGVVSYAVARRTREVGIRMALGSAPARVLAMFVGQTVPVLAGGIAAGVVVAALLARRLSDVLIGVSALDPLTFALACTVAGGVAILATWLPARRAARVDPLVALRDD